MERQFAKSVSTIQPGSRTKSIAEEARLIGNNEQNEMIDQNNQNEIIEQNSGTDKSDEVDELTTETCILIKTLFTRSSCPFKCFHIHPEPTVHQ